MPKIIRWLFFPPFDSYDVSCVRNNRETIVWCFTGVQFKQLCERGTVHEYMYTFIFLCPLLCCSLPLSLLFPLYFSLTCFPHSLILLTPLSISLALYLSSSLSLSLSLSLSPLYMHKCVKIIYFSLLSYILTLTCSVFLPSVLSASIISGNYWCDCGNHSKFFHLDGSRWFILLHTAWLHFTSSFPHGYLQTVRH